MVRPGDKVFASEAAHLAAHQQIKLAHRQLERRDFHWGLPVPGRGARGRG
jgi:hypothetical protein